MGSLGFTTTGHYRLLQVLDRTGSRLALDDEVQPAPNASGETTFALTEAAVHLGDRQLVWRDASYPHAKLHVFLRRWIYRDQTVTDLVKPAVRGGVGVWLVGLLIAIPMDVARARERRQGRRLNRAAVTSSGPFNRRPCRRSRARATSMGTATNRPTRQTPTPPHTAGITRSVTV